MKQWNLMNQLCGRIFETSLLCLTAAAAAASSTHPFSNSQSFSVSLRTFAPTAYTIKIKLNLFSLSVYALATLDGYINEH